MRFSCFNLKPFQKTGYNSLSTKRMKSGERYKILGLRKGTDGKLEYLVAWEGIKAPSEDPTLS